MLSNVPGSLWFDFYEDCFLFHPFFKKNKTLKVIRQTPVCHIQSRPSRFLHYQCNQLHWYWQFRLEGVTPDVCQRPVASSNARWRSTKLYLKPIRSREELSVLLFEIRYTVWRVLFGFNGLTVFTYCTEGCRTSGWAAGRQRPPVGLLSTGPWWGTKAPSPSWRISAPSIRHTE